MNAIAPQDFPQYLARIKDMTDRVLIPAEPSLDGQETLPERLTEAIRASGLFGISIPREYGGLGLSMEEQVRVMLHVTRASASYRARFSTTIGLGSQPIRYNGTEDQRRTWLPASDPLSGSVSANAAVTSPVAMRGSQVRRWSSVPL
jgi:acyl-CoA dehydrogenase